MSTAAGSQLRQLDKDHFLLGTGNPAGRRGDAEPGLADPGRPGERHEAPIGISEKPLQRHEFGRSPHKQAGIPREDQTRRGIRCTRSPAAFMPRG
jgi:hypothetical protein